MILLLLAACSTASVDTASSTVQVHDSRSTADSGSNRRTDTGWTDTSVPSDSGESGFVDVDYPICINEFMADNRSSLVNPDGSTPD